MNWNECVDCEKEVIGYISSSAVWNKYNCPHCNNADAQIGEQ